MVKLRDHSHFIDHAGHTKSGTVRYGMIDERCDIDSIQFVYSRGYCMPLKVFVSLLSLVAIPDISI